MKVPKSARILHRFAANGLVPVLISAVITGTPATARAGGVVGTGTAASCTDAALNTALAGGGLVTFSCGGSFVDSGAVTIDISTGTGTKVIAADTIVSCSAYCGPITISGGNTVRVFSVGPGVKLTLQGLVVANGLGTDFDGGGGIYNGGGTLTVYSGTFVGNTGGLGAAIYNDGGRLNVSNSTFDGNGNSTDSWNSGGTGGAIYNGSGSIDIANSTFTGNHALGVFTGGDGGAIYNGTGRLTVSNSAFRENVGGRGAAVYSSGVLTVTNSTFTDNVGAYGGGISSFGTLTVTNSTFSGNVAAGIFGVGTGGGLANYGDASLTDSNFTDNSAGSSGGGIGNAGTLNVANSTFTGNSALPNSIGNSIGISYGGGIENVGMLAVTNSTFTGNSAAMAGGGIENGSGNANPDATTVLRNTIVADSPSGGNCSGPITDGGHNLDDGTSCGFSAANGSLNDTNPQLDPAGLQLDNSGPSIQTVALCTAVGVPAGCAAASPAIDAGDHAVCAAPPVNNLDQRGYVRPGTGHTDCSIGAYEADAIPPAPCTGDCDGNGTVAINELILGVDIALGVDPVSACPALANSQGVVDIAQLTTGVNDALDGCGGSPLVGPPTT